MSHNQSAVFISYAWGGESEQLVNKLESALQNSKFSFIRDKRNLGFKGLIKDFMSNIGMGKAVVVVISDKYLKSPYCMFELMEIYRNRDFIDRIFPIVLEDAAIFDPLTRLAYLKHWQEKKTELEEAMKPFGAEAIPVVGDDYKVYRKIFNNFGEVVNILTDINALTPEMHQASHFKELYEALLQRLDEDSGYTKQKDLQKLLRQLSAGSGLYHQELTGINGPYHHLNISEAILAGISQAAAVEDTARSTLHTTVRNKNGEEFSLESSLHQLWQQEKPHVILLGDGGMGKTVSLIHFWESLLRTDQDNDPGTVPVFLSLHEYNTVSERERDGFIAKRLTWHYLGLKENQGETIDTLWNLFKTTRKTRKPGIILLLDGFNEVTVDSSKKNPLLLELQELRQKGTAVQIVISSRHEMNFTWAEGFQPLELQPLDEAKTKVYLQARHISYPEDQRLRQILHNPMMLTLYANASEIIEQYKGNKRFDFKPRITTQGELIWNYLEAQVVKLSKIYGREAADFYYCKFMIRHYLPYLGYEMEKASQFVLDDNRFLEMLSEASRYFYKKEFILAWPEYRSWLKDFNLAELKFAEEAERLEQITKTLCSDLCLIRRTNSMYEFLHQNFRDYFAAVHILNELAKEAQNRKIPDVLVHRSLPVYIRKFTGQIEGEHYQTESPCPPPTLLMQTLDNLRGIYEEEKTGYAIWNIVNIWKDTRQHLGGADLSQLDLRKTGLQDAFCYQRQGSVYNSARFDESLISEKGFLPQGHSGYVRSVAFHPDGKTFVSGSLDNTLKTWDLKTGENLATFQGHSGSVQSVTYHPDGEIFISGSKDSTIKSWNVKTGECLATFREHLNAVLSVDFHPDGKMFISGSDDRSIKLWDLNSGKCLDSFQEHRSAVLSVAFHADGKTFVSGSDDKTIKVWDLNARKCLSTLTGHNSTVTSLSFHPNGKIILSGSEDNTIKTWNLKTGECMATYQGHAHFVQSVAFHPDGKTFISGSKDNTIKAWDTKTGECLASFEGHTYYINNVAFHRDGKTFISGSDDKSIKAWDLKTGECLSTFKGLHSHVTSIAVHPHGKIFISGSWDTTIKVWDLQTGICLDTFQGHTDFIESTAIHPDGNVFISGSKDRTIKVWELQSGKCLASCQGHDSFVENVAFHPEGKTFISGSWDASIKAWDLKGECLGTFQEHGSPVKSVAFHPDGKTFISGSCDKSIKLWDLKTGECQATFQQNGPVNSVAINSNGKTFISGSGDHTIREWDLQSKECLANLKIHERAVNTVDFHPGGKTIVSGSGDNTIKAWNLHTGECLGNFEGHNDAVRNVKFHRDGNTFISGSADSTIKIWDFETGECLVTLNYVPGIFLAGCSFRNLHPESQLLPESKNMMRQHGAIFNEGDRQRFDEAVQRAFHD